MTDLGAVPEWRKTHSETQDHEFHVLCSAFQTCLARFRVPGFFPLTHDWAVGSEDLPRSLKTCMGDPSD